MLGDEITLDPKERYELLHSRYMQPMYSLAVSCETRRLTEALLRREKGLGPDEPLEIPRNQFHSLTHMQTVAERLLEVSNQLGRDEVRRQNLFFSQEALVLDQEEQDSSERGIADREPQ